MADRRDEQRKPHPGRKRLGEDILVPVTMKLEPSELTMINSIAKHSHRSRSDLMREMLSYGLSHVMDQAFGDADAGDTEDTVSTPARTNASCGIAVTTALGLDEMRVIDALSVSTHSTRSSVTGHALSEGLRLVNQIATAGRR